MTQNASVKLVGSGKIAKIYARLCQAHLRSRLLGKWHPGRSINLWFGKPGQPRLFSFR